MIGRNHVVDATHFLEISCFDHPDTHGVQRDVLVAIPDRRLDRDAFGPIWKGVGERKIQSGDWILATAYFFNLSPSGWYRLREFEAVIQ